MSWCSLLSPNFSYVIMAQAVIPSPTLRSSSITSAAPILSTLQLSQKLTTFPSMVTLNLQSENRSISKPSSATSLLRHRWTYTIVTLQTKMIVGKFLSQIARDVLVSTLSLLIVLYCTILFICVLVYSLHIKDGKLSEGIAQNLVKQTRYFLGK